MKKVFKSLPPDSFDKEATKVHYCLQCGKDMGYEWILGAVCGKCCKANHKKVTGRK